MKKIIIISIVLSIFASNLQGQKKNNWLKINTEKTDNIIKGATTDAEGNIYYLVIDKIKNYSKSQGVKIKKYSPELSYISKGDIVGNLPNNFIPKMIGQYLFVLPMSGIKNEPMNYVLIYDLQGNPVEKISMAEGYEYSSFKIGSKGFGYEPNELEFNNFNLSSNGKYYVTWGYSKGKKPTDKYNLIAYAFNMDFEKVNEVEFLFDNVFTAAFEIESFKVDVSNEGKIFCMCNNIEGAGKSKLSLAIFNNGNTPEVHHYPFKYDWTSYNYTVGKMGEVFICGLAGKTMKNALLDGFAAQSIFFINQPLNQKETIKATEYNIETQVKNSFPVFKEYISKQRKFYHPEKLLIMDDGILWIGIEAGYTDGDKDIIDYRSQGKRVASTIMKIIDQDDKTYYYTNSFSFFKFSFTGKLQWIQAIAKRMRISYPLSIYNSFGVKNEGDKIKLAYNDYFKNATKPLPTDLNPNIQTNIVPVYTEVLSDGTIKVKPLEIDGDGKLFYTPYTIFEKDNAVYLSVKPGIMSVGDIHGAVVETE